MQIDEAREFIKFLHGAVPWNGTWFGEYAPGERGAYWWRKHLDEAIAALIAAPAAPQQAEPVEIVPRVWREALRKLTFMARTSGGTPGPDEGLQTACAEAETLLSKPYNYPPAAPQQAESALNERVGLAYKNGYEEALNDCIRNGGEAWARSMFANGGEHIKPQQAEPVAWVRNLTDPQPHCVTGLQYRTAADADAGVQYIPVYLHPPAAEVRLQGGLDNEELLEAWRTKVPGVEPTDSDLRAFALGVEFGTRGKRVYFDERNSARDAWRRRVKQCETLEAEVQRLRDALKLFAAIDLTTNQAVDAMDVLRARRALEGGE